MVKSTPISTAGNSPRKPTTTDRPAGFAASAISSRHGSTKSAGSGRRQKQVALQALDAGFEALRSRLPELGPEVAAKIDALLKHPLNDHVKFQGRSFAVDGRAFPGLTTRLHDVYWPQTDENPKTRSKADRDRRQPLKFYEPKTQRDRRCKGTDAKHGKRVHAEVCRYINQFVSGKRMNASVRWDPCTIRILTVILNKEWLPVAGEFAIYDKSHKIATACDGLFVSLKTGGLILLEFKTGYEGEEYGPHPSDEAMRYPLERLPNCPKNRHILQLFAMVIIMRDVYKTSVSEAYVVHSCARKKHTALVGLPSWAGDPNVQKGFYDRLAA
jgi:hypothetical protein